MDPISLAVGAGILVVGWVAGRLHGRVAAARRRLPEEKPICGCTHHRSLHEPETGRCQGQTRRGNWFDGYHYVNCRCRQYAGPVPIETLWTPPVLPEGSDR